MARALRAAGPETAAPARPTGQDSRPGAAFFRPAVAPVRPTRPIRPLAAGTARPGATGAAAVSRQSAVSPGEPERLDPPGTRSDPAALTEPRTATPGAEPVAPWLVRHTPHRGVVVTDVTCSPLAEADHQSLGVTYWFEAEPTGEPYPMTVHLDGRLKQSAPGTGAGRTTFAVTSTVDKVQPGSGQVAVTTRVPHLAHGEWEVTATPVVPASASAPAPWAEVRSPRLPRASASGRTAAAPVVAHLAPGVFVGAWPALVGLGFLVGLGLQAVLARGLGLPVLPLLLLTVLAGVLGLGAAKAYFLITHPQVRRSLSAPGMSVQGFVIASIATLVLGSVVLGIPVGGALDVTAPALLVGMAVGRPGCLLGGCCVGRPTASRWGVWSSDRRLGVRRIPVQLLESVLSATLAVLALVAVTVLPAAGSGLILVATVAAYVLGRQILFPLRDLPRATTHGRLVTLAASALTLTASVTAILAISAS